MKKQVVLLFSLMVALVSNAQVTIGKDFSVKMYGQIRTDLYYNTRDNVQSVDGLFYMYPKDKSIDYYGKDRNDADNSNLYAVYSRLGFDFAGPKLGKAKTSAKIEFDFRGNGNDNLSIVRLRHAYFNLDWGKSKLLVGQTWHPFYGDVAPQILNLNMGAPFQPFGRAPQIRYRYQSGDIQWQIAALWQSQYKTYGPTAADGSGNSRVQQFHKNSNIPELTLGVDYKADGWIAGVGMDMLSIVPRTQANPKGRTHRVNERLTTLSYEAHVKYTNDKLYFAAKSTLGANMTHLSMTGGYGIKSESSKTGERKYTAFRNSSTWVNIAYGKKWKPALFLGYMKNLGTTDDLMPEYTNNATDGVDTHYAKTYYGTGTNLDKLMSATFELTYNVPHWKIGAEFNYTSAWYGTNKINGKVEDTHSVGNSRLVVSALYTF